jgi:hypothetical protein
MTSSASERMRRTRARRAAGRLLLQIEVPEAELIDVLIFHGMLYSAVADDPGQIARAVERTLAALIAEHVLRATPDGGGIL